MHCRRHYQNYDSAKSLGIKVVAPIFFGHFCFVYSVHIQPAPVWLRAQLPHRSVIRILLCVFFFCYRYQSISMLSVVVRDWFKCTCCWWVAHLCLLIAFCHIFFTPLLFRFCCPDFPFIHSVLPSFVLLSSPLLWFFFFASSVFPFVLLFVFKCHYLICEFPCAFVYFTHRGIQVVYSSESPLLTWMHTLQRDEETKRCQKQTVQKINQKEQRSRSTLSNNALAYTHRHAVIINDIH